MKRIALLLVLPVMGCSTSPVADFLDHFFPSRPSATPAAGRGGVCNPAPVATPPPVVGPATPVVPGGAVVVPGAPPPLSPAPGAGVVIPGGPAPSSGPPM